MPHDPTNDSKPQNSRPAVERRTLDDLIRHLLSITKKIRLSVAVAFVGWLFGSYFQYISWRDQQNIDMFKQDFAAANAVFAEVSGFLSAAMNLQQMVAANFRGALSENVDTNDAAFLTVSARRLDQTYVDARNSLRENIDVLARKMEIFVDWASDPTHDPSAKGQGVDVMSRSTLGVYDFDCNKHSPDGKSINTLTVLSIEKQGKSPLQVDWRSTKHHVLTFQYCLEEIHRRILPARQWASNSPVDTQEKARFVADKDFIASLFDKQVDRLNVFMLLTMWRIDDIRLRYQTKGYRCHVLGWCGS